MLNLKTARLTLRSPRLRTKPQLSGEKKRKSVSRGPGKHWLNKPAVIVRRGGKEICNLATPEGEAEYKWRVMLMWVRQDGLCCDCGMPLRLADATFEHQDGRGAGRRDDRIAIFDDSGRFVKHINGAAHGICNGQRGSRRTEIHHGNNCFIELGADR